MPKLAKPRNIFKKISYTPGKWNFLALIMKNFLYFFKRKLFLYFGKRRSQKDSLYFRKWKFLIFQEIQTLKSFLYSGSNFPRSKNEKNTLKMF